MEESDNINSNIEQGSVYVYRRDGNNWIETKLIASDGGTYDHFGDSLSLTSNGNTIAIGANTANAEKGAVYIYRWDGIIWTEDKLTATDGEFGDSFGTSVSINNDGSMLVIGADLDNIGNNMGQGSVYIYRE